MDENQHILDVEVEVPNVSKKTYATLIRESSAQLAEVIGNIKETYGKDFEDKKLLVCEVFKDILRLRYRLVEVVEPEAWEEEGVV